MPLDERDQGTIEDLLRYANDAKNHVADMDLESFVADRTIQQAAMYAIATVAEAVGKLSPTVLNASSQIPWHMIRGMRNILMHEYGRVDLPTVYRVATEEIPRLIAQVTAIRDQLDG